MADETFRWQGVEAVNLPKMPPTVEEEQIIAREKRYREQRHAEYCRELLIQAKKEAVIKRREQAWQAGRVMTPVEELAAETEVVRSWQNPPMPEIAEDEDQQRATMAVMVTRLWQGG